MNSNQFTPSDKDFEIITNRYFFENFKETLIDQLYKQAEVYYGSDDWYAIEFTTSPDKYWDDESDNSAHLDIIMRTKKGEKAK